MLVDYGRKKGKHSAEAKEAEPKAKKSDSKKAEKLNWEKMVEALDDWSKKEEKSFKELLKATDDAAKEALKIGKENTESIKSLSDKIDKLLDGDVASLKPSSVSSTSSAWPIGGTWYLVEVTEEKRIMGPEGPYTEASVGATKCRPVSGYEYPDRDAGNILRFTLSNVSAEKYCSRNGKIFPVDLWVDESGEIRRRVTSDEARALGLI